MQDLMGKDISAGDFVVYAQRRSSSMWVNIAKVLEVSTEEIIVRGITPSYDINKWQLNSRNSSLTTGSRIAIVEPSESIREMLKDFTPVEFAVSV